MGDQKSDWKPETIFKAVWQHIKLQWVEHTKRSQRDTEKEPFYPCQTSFLIQLTHTYKFSSKPAALPLSFRLYFGNWVVQDCFIGIIEIKLSALQVMARWYLSAAASELGKGQIFECFCRLELPYFKRIRGKLQHTSQKQEDKQQTAAGNCNRFPAEKQIQVNEFFHNFKQYKQSCS